jgi:phosphate transport system protein
MEFGVTHRGQHLHREIDKLKKHILTLSTLVEESFQKAVFALESGNVDMAREIASKDDVIDSYEVEMEEECLKILALHQPVATDLRFIISVLKINQSLERIGDMSVKIAKTAVKYGTYAEGKERYLFVSMADKTKAAFKNSLDAFINLSTDRAREVCAGDAEINRMKKEANERILKDIISMPEKAEYFLALYNVARCLERVGDLARAIAEDVIYLVDADIVRHKLKNL